MMAAEPAIDLAARLRERATDRTSAGRPAPRDAALLRQAAEQLEALADIAGRYRPRARRMVGIAEAAEALGRSPRTVRRLAAEERIPARKVGARSWLIEIEEDQ